MFTKCSRCSNNSEGKSRCKTCSIKRNEEEKQKYIERKSLGLCIVCGNKNNTNFNECFRCKEKTIKRMKKVNAKRKEGDKKRREDGKCFARTCKKLRLDSCKFCEEHKLLDLSKRKERFLKLIKDGLCTSCGAEPYMNYSVNRNIKTKHCKICYLKNLSVTHLGKANRWNELLDILIKQNYLCPYTGDKLVLGESASVDHVLSRSKYPEKQKDINNLVWVSRTVNRMKHNYTDEEFMNLIEKIYKYRKEMEEREESSLPPPP